MAPSRAARAPVATGVASAACAVGLAALVLARAGETAGAIGVRLAGLALLCLVTGLVLGWASLVPAALLLLGAAYAIQLSVDGPSLDAAAPFFAGGLLATAELGYWSLEERARARGDPGEGLRRLGLVAVLTLGAAGVGAVLVAVIDLARTAGLAVDLLGAGAAATAILVVMLAARRP